MPKLKTHKGAAKRIKRTGSGKLLRRKAFSNHFLTKKRASRKRQYKKEHAFGQGDKKTVERMSR